MVLGSNLAGLISKKVLSNPNPNPIPYPGYLLPLQHCCTHSTPLCLPVTTKHPKPNPDPDPDSKYRNHPKHPNPNPNPDSKSHHRQPEFDPRIVTQKRTNPNPNRNPNPMQDGSGERR